MDKNKWKNLVLVLIVTGILLALLFMATSGARLTPWAKVMITVLVTFCVLAVYAANRLMETYFNPAVKRYVTYFCWTAFLVAASIVYSFIGLVAEVNSRNHPLNAFLTTRVMYYNADKLEFTAAYDRFVKDGCLKNVDLERFNRMISLEQTWINNMLLDKRAVLQRKDVNPSAHIFGNDSFLKEIKQFAQGVVVQLKKEPDLEKRLESYKKLMVFSQLVTRMGLFGTNTTLIESLVGFALEKRTVKGIMDFMNSQPDFWTAQRKEEFSGFLMLITNTRLTVGEAYDGEHEFMRLMMHYLYVRHTYAMFWLDLYFGSASMQHNRVMRLFMEGVHEGRNIGDKRWKEIQDACVNPLIAISIPNLSLVYEKFRGTDLYFLALKMIASGKPQSDPFVPGKDILEKSDAGMKVYYSRGLNMIDEGGKGDDITVNLED